MARRSDHSREELTAMALEAARDIVVREGFTALNARAVAGRIGYSVGTLYNLFQNLDELIVALNGGTLDLLHDALAAVPRRGDPEQDLRALAAAYVAFTQDHANLWQVLFEHRLPPGQELPPWYFDKLARPLALVEDAVAPLFAPDAAADRRDAIRVLWCGLHGICSLASSGKLGLVTGTSTRALAEQLVADVVAGLRARRDRTA